MKVDFVLIYVVLCTLFIKVMGLMKIKSNQILKSDRKLQYVDKSLINLFKVPHICYLLKNHSGSKICSNLERRFKRHADRKNSTEDFIKLNFSNLINRMQSNIIPVSENKTLIKKEIYDNASATSNSNGNDTNLFDDDVYKIKQRFKRLYPVKLWMEHGWFEEEYLDLINIHWLQFSPPPKSAHYILAIIYTSVAICGFFGNVLVIFMFFKCQSLRTPANILVVNLAVSDFFMIAKTPLFIYNSAYLGPATGQIGCKIYGFVGGITGTVSIGTLAAIAFDRYSVVVYPLEPLRNITKLRAKISVITVWVYGCFFASIPALDIGLGRYVPEGYLTSCSFDYLSDNIKHKIFIFSFFCAAWLLPLLVISFCYINILRVVIKTRSMGKKFGSISSRHCKVQEKRKTELKLAGVVIGVIALFFAAWTPYSIVALLGITGYKQLILPITSMIPAIFCKVASCIDPFVYIVTHPKFRQECKNLLVSKKEMRRRRSTFRSVVSSNRYNLQNQRTPSYDEVEVIEMSKIPFSKDLKRTTCKSISPIDTVSLRTHARGSALDDLPKTKNDNRQLQSPSWYIKPRMDNYPC